MPFPSANLDRFLRIVHLRLRVLRFLEYVGFGMGISAAFAIGLVALLTWRGAPLLIPSICSLALGMIGGSAWGFARRPTALDAASEADRQLGLADLLGSALLVRDCAAMDPWAASVIATADARCAVLSPSRVLLHRLGLRAWGGIGLATALVLTIALLAGNPSDIRAENVASQSARSTAPNTPARPGHPLLDLTVAGSSGPTTPRQDVQDEISNRTGETSSPQPEDAGAKNPAVRESDADSHASIATPNGHGGGAARTDAPHRATDVPPVRSVAGQRSNPSGLAAAGVGNPETEVPRPGPDGISGVNAALAPAITHVAPWQSGQWQADVSRAHHAIESGQIPPAYRDLVRDYFDRNQ